MKRPTRRLAWAVVSAVSSISMPALGAALYWDVDTVTAGAGGSGNWAATGGTNWNTAPDGSGTAGAWVTGSDAVFGGTAGNVTVSTQGVTVSAISFTSSGYNISRSSTNVLTLSSTSLIDTGANSATISALMGGVTTLTKTGSGTLTLAQTAANTFTGTVNLNDGTTLLAGSGNGISAAIVSVGDSTGAAGTAVLRNNAINQISDSAVLTIRSDGLYDIGGFSETVSIINTTVGSAGVTNSGGAATLSSSFALGGGGSVHLGTLAASMLKITSTTTYNVVAGGATANLTAPTIDLAGVARTFSINDDTALGTELTLNGAVTGSIAQGVVQFTKNGNGVMKISGPISYVGNTAIAAGAVWVDDGTNGINSLAAGSYITLSGTGVLAGSGTFSRNLAAAGGVGVNNAVGMAGGGFAAVGGTLTINLNNAPGSTITWGGTGFSAGTLLFGAAVADNVVTFNHALNLNGTARTISVIDNPNSTADKAVVSGTITGGAVGLSKGGTGVLELQGGGDWTGGIMGGNSGGVNGAAGGTLRFNGGTYAIAGTYTMGSGVNTGNTATMEITGGANVTVGTTTGGLTMGAVNDANYRSQLTIDAGSRLRINGATSTGLTMGAGSKLWLNGTAPGTLVNTMLHASATNGGPLFVSDAGNAFDAVAGTLQGDGYGALNPNAITSILVQGNGTQQTTPHLRIGDAVKQGQVNIRGGGTIFRVTDGAFVQMGTRTTNARDVNGNPLGTVTSSGVGFTLASISGQTNTFASVLQIDGTNSWFDLIGSFGLGSGTHTNGAKAGVVRVLDGGRLDVTGSIGTRNSNAKGSIYVNNGTLRTQGQPADAANFLNPSGGVAPGSYTVIGSFDDAASNVEAQVIVSGATGRWDSLYNGEGGPGWGAGKRGVAISIGESYDLSRTGTAVSGLVRVENYGTINSNFANNLISVGSNDRAGFTGTIDIWTGGVWNHTGGALAGVTDDPTYSDHVIIGPRGTMNISSGGKFLASGSDRFLVTSGSATGGTVNIDGNGSILATPAMFLKNTHFTRASVLSNIVETAGSGTVSLSITNGGKLDLTSASTDSVFDSNSNTTLNGGTIEMESGRTLQIAGDLRGNGTVTGNIALAGSTTLTMKLAGVGGDQLSVAGAVELGGSTLSLDAGFGTGLVNGEVYYIVANDGGDAVNGTFAGLAQGDTVTTLDGLQFQISYIADSVGHTFGGGNDIGLLATSVPEPAGLSILGLGALALRRRRRRS